MPRQLSQKDLLTKIAKMEKENADSKVARKSKKVLWKEQSLKDSLYNKDEKGGRIPKIDDIDQCSYSHLNYLLKQKGINDCYLLTNLMELARKHPNFIVNNLITVMGDDEVEVNFYKVQTVVSGEQKIIYQPDGAQVHYNVKKSEALAWKTCHKALWPVVVEIAFAKYLRDIWNEREDVKNLKASLRKSAEEFVRDNAKEKLSDEDFEERVSKILTESGWYDDGDLRGFFGLGRAAYALSILTGKKSNLRMNLDFKKLLASTTDENLRTYSASVLRIYDKIRNKLDKGKIITVVFNTTNYTLLKSSKLSRIMNLPGLGDGDADDVALKTIALAKLLKRDAVGTVGKLVREDIINEKQVNEWMIRNRITIEGLKTQSDDVRKRFVLETVYSNLDDYKFSTTKTGIISRHAYLVLDAVERNGRKYIIIRNPHGIKTKINYQRGNRALPPEAILPKEIYKAKNECSVELNHFCKLLSSISYDK